MSPVGRRGILRTGESVTGIYTLHRIVVCDHFTKYGTRVSECRTAVYSTPQECLLHWYDKVPDYSTLWDKLIRRDLFVRNGILPYPGIDLGEDFCCTVRLFYYARIMSYRGNSLKSRLIWYLALRNATVYAMMKKIIPSLR